MFKNKWDFSAKPRHILAEVIKEIKYGCCGDETGTSRLRTEWIYMYIGCHKTGNTRWIKVHTLQVILHDFLTLCLLGNFSCFLSSADFFSK